ELAADDAVGANPGARFDDGAFVDEARRLHDRAVFDARLRRDPRRAGRRHERRRLPADVAAVHDVAVHLHVLLGRADVDPVPAIDEGNEGFLPLDERGKEAALDRPGHVFRYAIERVRLEHVNAGVDRVAGDLVGVRLLEKPYDVAVRIGFNQTVRARILDRREDDRGPGFALSMQLDDRA